MCAGWIIACRAVAIPAPSVVLLTVGGKCWKTVMFFSQLNVVLFVLLTKSIFVI